MNKKNPKRAYLIGIKGVAMTSLAVYLKEKGYKVTGSDVTDVFSTDSVLNANKIKILPGFNPVNVPKNADFVVATGAHGGATNIEAVQARLSSIPFYMHGRFLGKIMEGKYGIAVAGCHGKTTTSAMISFVAKSAGLEPSYSVGTAYISNLGPAGHYGRGKYFIAEADEYMTCPLTDRTPRFLHLNPKIAVITNIEFDHPDEFNNIDEVKNAFLKFSSKIIADGVLITCIDDPIVASIIDKFSPKRIITYGFSPRADYRIENSYQNENAAFMKITNKNLTIGEFMILLPGKHNLSNALAALIACREMGLSWKTIKGYISNFQGTNRRFELIGKYAKASLYDDYAHHPSEIKATISAIKSRFPQKQLFLIFQPHTFSRTKRLLPDFAASFKQADVVAVADIFPSARESFDPDISSGKLVRMINTVRNNAVYIKGISDLEKLFNKKLTAKALVITMGAGDLYRWHKTIGNLLNK